MFRALRATFRKSRQAHVWSAFTFCIAVGVDRVVGEADLVAFPCGVNHKVCGEKKRRTVLGVVVERKL